MYVRPCLTGHDSKTWPIVLHPRHVKRSSRVSVGCTSSSFLTVLLSTISSEFESCSMDVSTVTSVPPGPSSGKVGSDAGGCNPSLGLFSVLSVSGGSSMASWYNCAISSSPMVISKYGTSLVTVSGWMVSVFAFCDGSTCMVVSSTVVTSSDIVSPVFVARDT